MKLEIFNHANRTRNDIIRTYTYVQYTEQFNDVGNFILRVPWTDESILFIQYNNYILFDDGIMGVIRAISITEEEGNELEISGYLLNGMLSKRSFLLTTSYYDTVSNIARSMVTDLVINPDNIERRIMFIKLSNDSKYNPTFTNKIRVQNTGDKLNEVIQEMFITENLGYKLYPNIKNYNQSTGEGYNFESADFRIIKPADRSNGNTEGNEPVVFSFELNNLQKLFYAEDGTDYNTIAIVASEGVGTSRKIITVGDETFTGELRDELYVDARDLQSEDSDGNKITDEQLEELMIQRGNEKLEEHQKFISLTATVITQETNFEYGKDFFLGDFVTVMSKTLNREFKLQITEAIKTISEGVEHLDFSFGYDKVQVTKLFKGGKDYVRNKWVF